MQIPYLYFKFCNQVGRKIIDIKLRMTQGFVIICHNCDISLPIQLAHEEKFKMENVVFPGLKTYIGVIYAPDTLYLNSNVFFLGLSQHLRTRKDRHSLIKSTRLIYLCKFHWDQ